MKDLEFLLEILHGGAAATIAAALDDEEQQQNKRKIVHRQLPRSSRRLCRNDHALVCIERDYICDTPLLGVEFKLMFRLSRGRFQVLMVDVMASNIAFFKSTVRDGFDRSSLAARLLLPLKSLAYRVPPHTFIDYFQMSPQYDRLRPPLLRF
jgi:hypothetical protein